MTDRFLCNKCQILFEVGPKRGESTMCAAPDCRVRFWHIYSNLHDGNNSATVGITPEDAASLKAVGEVPELREIVA